MARRMGYPKSRVPEGASYYTKCCNLPVQGACADASMLALAYVDDRLFEAGISGGPVAWLHDEIVIEVREDQAERAAEILKQAMVDGFAETFPGAPLNGLVEPYVGLSWGEAKARETPNSSQPPEPDYARAYRERIRLAGEDGRTEEVRLRAVEAVVNLYRNHHPSADVDTAKAAVLAAMKRGAAA
jgi:hypothetical protein